MSDPKNFHDVTSPENFQTLLSEDLQRVSLINFWAPWAAPCTQMNQIVLELAKKYSHLLVLQVEAEAQSEIAESFNIEAVPTFLILRGHTLLDRIAGADASLLTSAVEKYAGRVAPITPQSQTSEKPTAPAYETPAELEKRMQGLMAQSNAVLFMKGSPDEPRCGFSRKLVALLREQNIEFTHFDILTDESVRQGLKVLNDWPTFPQFVVNSEFVGGLDIVREMADNGELAELMK